MRYRKRNALFCQPQPHGFSCKKPTPYKEYTGPFHRCEIAHTFYVMTYFAGAPICIRFKPQ
jgi:hypothetical protein